MQNEENYFASYNGNIIDDAVSCCICDIDPNFSIPDDNNVIDKSNKYKAPDFSINNDDILIECKSLNSIDNGQIFKKLGDIAKSEGKEIHGVGYANTNQVFKRLNDPESAARIIADYSNDRLLQHLKATRKKFEEHLNENPNTRNSVRILIVSDNRNWKESPSGINQFLGRKMGGVNDGNDISGLIDAIVFIKRPKYVLLNKKGSWFNCLYKSNTHTNNSYKIKQFAFNLAQKISLTEPIYSEQKGKNFDVPFYIDCSPL
jgi:hypothetical protein